MLTLFFLSFVIPLFAFFFESYPRFMNRKFGVDIWTHLLYLKEYHKQKGIPKNIANGFLIPGSYDYPPVFIFILSKFPFKAVERYEFLFSPFFDFLHISLFFWIVYSTTQSLQLSFITQALYVLTPIIVLENSSATPRSLGYTLFTIVFVCLFIYGIKGEWLFFVLAILFGSLIFLSHRFTTQGFLFFCIFFAILDRSFFYIVAFVVSLVLAVVLSKGFYFKVLKGHIGNLSFWYKNIEYRFAHQVKGNLKEYKTQDFIFRMYNEFLKFPPFVFTITNPWTVASLYFFFTTFSDNPLFAKFAWLVMFSYVVALATVWIPQLRFLGEGQRYLELSAFPAAFLSAYVLIHFMETQLSFWVLSGYALVGCFALVTIVFIQRKAIIKEELRTVTESMEEMFAFLRSFKKKPRLLCVPHQITTNVIYHTGCPVLVNADYATIEKISEIYPYIKVPISYIMKKYNLEMILLNNDYSSVKDLQLTQYTIIKQIGNFSLVKV